MRDYLEIGLVPGNEPCPQIGSETYAEDARAAGKRFIELIIEKLGEPPSGSSLRVKAFPHDFGTYHEVVVYFDDSERETIDYAFKVEAEAPSTWGDNGTS